MQTEMKTDELEVKQWKTRRKGEISIFDPKIIRARHSGVVQETRPARAGQEPGDVRGGGRQCDHHHRVRAPAVHATDSGTFTRSRAHLRDDLRAGGRRLALVHGRLRQLRRGDGRGTRQGAGRHAAPRAHDHHGETAGKRRPPGRRARSGRAGTAQRRSGAGRGWGRDPWRWRRGGGCGLGG